VYVSVEVIDSNFLQITLHTHTHTHTHSPINIYSAFTHMLRWVRQEIVVATDRSWDEMGWAVLVTQFMNASIEIH